MEDLIASIPVLAGTAVIVIAIFIFTSRAKRQREKIVRELAAREGWEYQPVSGRLESGFRLSAGEWTFESIRTSTDRPSESGSSDISHSTRWDCRLPGTAVMLVYIGEKPPGADSGFGGSLIRQAFHMMLGDEGAGMQEVQAGTSSFQRRYLVMSRRPGDAENLLTPHLENLLVNYKGRSPVIRVDSEGISMKADGGSVAQADEILSFIRLGEALVDARR